MCNILFTVLIYPEIICAFLILKSKFSITNDFLELIYSPRKVAKDEVAYLNSKKKKSTEIKEEKAQKEVLALLEKADARRFRAAEKELVFYALIFML